MNWQWPNCKKNPNLNPWYTVIRRLIFWPATMCAIFVLIIIVAFGHGLGKAQEVWEIMTGNS